MQFCKYFMQFFRNFSCKRAIFKLHYYQRQNENKRHCPNFCENFSKSIGNTIFVIRLNITHEVWFGNIHKTLVCLGGCIREAMSWFAVSTQGSVLLYTTEEAQLQGARLTSGRRRRSDFLQHLRHK